MELRLVRRCRVLQGIAEGQRRDKIRDGKGQFLAGKLLDRHDLLELNGYMPRLDVLRLLGSKRRAGQQGDILAMVRTSDRHTFDQVNVCRSSLIRQVLAGRVVGRVFPEFLIIFERGCCEVKGLVRLVSDREDRVLNRIIWQRRARRFGIKQETIVGFFGQNGMGVLRGVKHAIDLTCTAKTGTSLVWPIAKGCKEQIVQACAFFRVRRFTIFEQLLEPILLLGAGHQFHRGIDVLRFHGAPAHPSAAAGVR